MAVAAALTAGWQALVAPRLPDEPYRVDMERGRIVWLGPGLGPYYCRQDLASASLLVTGDSRIYNGVEPVLLDDAGLGPTAVLWAGGARLTEWLPALRRFPPRRLLVALSVLALTEDEPGPGTLILRDEPPPFGPDHLEADLRGWAEDRRALLQAHGFALEESGPILDGMVAQHRAWALRASLAPAEIDRRLNDLVDRERRRLLRTITPNRWDAGWFHPLDEGVNDPVYLRHVARGDPSVRRRNLARTEELLSGLRRDGWEIACVRLPMAARLRVIEEASFPSRDFRDMCARLRVPYLDHSRDRYRTRDGSHLTGDSALQFSRVLAGELAALGWDRDPRPLGPRR